MSAGILLLPAAAFALGDWVAVGRGSKRLEYFFKPATTAALLGAAVGLGYDHASGPFEMQKMWMAIMVALAFSLAGDVFLMLSDRWFVYGLASFLLAHVGYVIAFSPWDAPVATLGAIVAIAVIPATLLLARIDRGLKQKGWSDLRLPVYAYVGVITAMVVAAWSLPFRDLVGTGPAWAAATGATLFYVSDALIGWHRFVGSLSRAPVTIMVTYHLGQAGLILSLAG